MESVKWMRVAKFGYIIIALILCLLGVFILYNPTISPATLNKLCSILFLIFGFIKLIGYYSNDLFQLAFQYDFEFGIFMIMIGIVLYLRPLEFVSFICIALGISVIFDGLFRVRMALEAKVFGIGSWWIVFLMAIINCIFGGFLMLHIEEGSMLLMYVLGITFIVEGMLSLATAITMVKMKKSKHIDINGKESEEK